MRGGSRVNSGPPPDPNAVRRDRPVDQQTWTMLDPDSRVGKKAPPFPLVRRESYAVETHDEDYSTDYSDHLLTRARRLDKRERALWTEIWRLPQAAQWKAGGWTYDIALYCRLMVDAELGDAKAASEARQWSDRLGLSAASMLRLRWRIRPEPTARPAEAPLAEVTHLGMKARRQGRGRAATARNSDPR
ncbi:hypothetical protein JT358_11630 [Micrococcales bacterium 31B]|nr:hypothetical protein [Micrococcales bacterium 31B]